MLGDAFTDNDVDVEQIRVVDHHVAEGVTSDEGDGDGWSAVHAARLARLLQASPYPA